MERLNCIFCHPGKMKVLVRGKHGYSMYDGYPVSPGHALVIPFRHAESPFELSGEECSDLWRILLETERIIAAEFHPDGFNIGVNIGEAAGQTIPHVHIHVIPRYLGDVDNPEGGVRGVIPGKRMYRGREGW